MGFIKCPRCELNYIQEEEQYCSVCKREMKGEVHEDLFELCSICNENPVMPGKDVCVFCYKEMQAHEEEHENEGTISVDVGIDPVSSMEEIVPDIGDDIPNGEFQEIETDLSLEEMGDEEADDEDEEE